ncbi:guanine deaminase [Tepiditoga spiralis]|uniref:Guanine deaminase n=1 Tax=Tepiditoga spiralis TaxID=2108365 RepID=A0A7G1G5E2_9BACT|nr:amidohydrolase family protein [Tepiditoga spiralis]BBE31335.1 guanine deaminase [Tepiditoga spiralis]
MDKKIIKGNFIFSKNLNNLSFLENTHLLINDGKILDIFKEVPTKYKNLNILDFKNKIIIPPFVDLHLHAPQYAMRGLGMDKELLDWLNTYTFKEENKFKDIGYAKRIYNEFAKDLIKHGTLRAVIFATIHKKSTEILFEVLEKYGLETYVGKVNMDRNCPEFLKENTEKSLKETEELILNYKNNKKSKPIITPRFAPTSTQKLLKGLGELAIKYNIPIQSHLSENQKEVKWVKELYNHNYSEVYNENNLFGQTPTLMAHCIYLTKKGIELMKNNRVIAVHCPQSNVNLASGIMPVRTLLNEGLNIGLGSDIGAGHSIAIKRSMVMAIELSKLIYKDNKNLKPLSTEEVFFMATKGSDFFGKIGEFNVDFSFDALIIDDSNLGTTELTLKERLQRFIYIGDDRNIIKRYLNGKEINF